VVTVGEIKDVAGLIPAYCNILS